MRRAPFWLAGALLLCIPATGWAQVEISSGDTKIRLGGRLQAQLVTSSCSAFPIDPDSPCGSQVPDVNWFIRRARFTIDIRINERISGRIAPDFGEVDGVELKDAWGRLTFSPAARLQIGRFKRPFDGFQLISSTRGLTIERDLDVPGVPGLTAASLDELTTRFALSDRDVGFMLNGRTAGGRFRYWLGTFNGQLPEENGDQDSKKQLVARAAVSLELGAMPVQLAAAAAFTDRPFTAATGELRGEYYSDFELWAELGDWDEGVHVQAGFVFGENPLQNVAGGSIDLAADEEFANMNAWQAIASYRVPIEGAEPVRAIEPIFRVTRAEPNTDLADDEVWGFTPGMQIFFTGRNKIVLNWDFVTFADDTTKSVNSFKAQYQFHF